MSGRIVKTVVLVTIYDTAGPPEAMTAVEDVAIFAAGAQKTEVNVLSTDHLGTEETAIALGTDNPTTEPDDGDPVE